MTPKTARRPSFHTASTPSRQWHFSGRAAAPLRKLPFANQAGKSMPRDCGRSRLVRPDQQGRGDERLLLQAANWRCRPKAEIQWAAELSFCSQADVAKMCIDSQRI